MSELWIVIKREFRERTRSRAFILSTILLPVLAGGVLAVPFLIERMQSGSSHHIAVVDESGSDVGARLSERLAAPAMPDGGDSIRVDRLERSLEAVRDSLAEASRNEELDGFLWIGEDFLESGHAVYRAPVVTNWGLNQRLQTAISEVVQGERLERAGLDGGEVAALLAPGELETSQITSGGEAEGDAQGTMALAFIITFVLYLFLILYGSQVMQSVHEEKSNRIAEVLMSSIRAPYLLAGKVFGVGGAAMVQMAIWGLLAVTIISQRQRISAAVGLPTDTLEGLRVDLEPATGFLLLVVALLGFFLYSSLFAVVGAATRDMQDSQQFMWVLLLPLIVPMILQAQIVSEPHGTLATALTWIPFTSPLALPIRMGTTTVPAVQITGALVLLLAAIAVVSWFAGKIYRVGMLNAGKRASVADLWRWVRMG